MVFNRVGRLPIENLPTHRANTMLILTITFCCSFAGGLVVAHELNQISAVTQPLLSAYQQRLAAAREHLKSLGADDGDRTQPANARNKR
jgi:hypothetical protein